MRLFALSDPHLSFDGQGNAYKPMDIFGDGWQNHSSRIQTQWLEQVQADDVVLLPGDMSWAMRCSPIWSFWLRCPVIKLFPRATMIYGGTV